MKELATHNSSVISHAGDKVTTRQHGTPNKDAPETYFSVCQQSFSSVQNEILVFSRVLFVFRNVLNFLAVQPMTQFSLSVELNINLQGWG